MSIFNWGKKKKQQNSQDEFFKILGEGLNAALDNSKKQNPVLLANQYVWEPNYGLDKTNPIIAESLSGTTNYLSRLCTPDGRTFTWSHYTSVRSAVHGLPDVGEDKYTLYLNGQPYTEVYFVPYVGRSKFPPAGLNFVDDRKDWTADRLAAKQRYERTGTIQTEEEQKEGNVIYF